MVWLLYISVGNDGIPTYSSEPDQCVTKTASLCVTTTSIGASTTQVASACEPIRGCDVDDSATTTATSSGCSTSTVTDFVCHPRSLCIDVSTVR